MSSNSFRPIIAAVGAVLALASAATAFSLSRIQLDNASVAAVRVFLVPILWIGAVLLPIVGAALMAVRLSYASLGLGVGGAIAALTNGIAASNDFGAPAVRATALLALLLGFVVVVAVLVLETQTRAHSQ